MTVEKFSLGSYKSISFLATVQPAVAREFYEQTLGLTFIADEPVALVFQINGRMLRIAKVEKLTPAPNTVLGWEVPDIGAVVSCLASRGVVFERYSPFDQDELGIWSSPGGARVAWFKDPDGNTLSLTQW